MTLADIDDAMGWAPGTARRTRWREPEHGGLPPSDAELGGVPLWLRATIEHWRAHRPGHHPTPPGDHAAAVRLPTVEQNLGPPQEDPTQEDTSQPDTEPSSGGTPGVPAPHQPGEPTELERSPEHGPAPDVNAPQPTPDTGTAPQLIPAEEATPDTPPDADLSTRPLNEVTVQRTVETGFELEAGQHVIAYVHRAWHDAVVRRRDRRTVVIDYNIDDTPLGARQQRVAVDRVRIPTAEHERPDTD
jgi:hypothetical protein